MDGRQELRHATVSVTNVATEGHLQPRPLQCSGHVDVYGLECKKQPLNATLKGGRRGRRLVNSLHVILMLF